MNDDKFVTEHISIRGAQLYFRNFAGEKGELNPKGLRNFGVFLDQELAEQLAKDGWNVKLTKKNQRDPDAPQRPFLKVEVSYKKRAPIVVLKKGERSTRLEEKELKMLDWVEISNVDLIINPYNWDVNGKTGVKGYLKSIYVTIIEDEFAAEYTNAPDSDDPDEDD